MTSGFRRDADEVRAFLGYNTASSGNPLLTFRDNILVPPSKGQEVQEKDGNPLYLINNSLFIFL
jgi:hypothetical protein